MTPPSLATLFVNVLDMRDDHEHELQYIAPPSTAALYVIVFEFNVKVLVPVEVK